MDQNIKSSLIGGLSSAGFVFFGLVLLSFVGKSYDPLLVASFWYLGASTLGLFVQLFRKQLYSDIQIIFRQWKQTLVFCTVGCIYGLLFMFTIIIAGPAICSISGRVGGALIVLIGVVFLKERVEHKNLALIATCVLGSFIFISGYDFSTHFTGIVLAMSFVTAILVFEITKKKIDYTSDGLTLCVARALSILAVLGVLYNLDPQRFSANIEIYEMILFACGGFSSAILANYFQMRAYAKGGYFWVLGTIGIIPSILIFIFDFVFLDEIVTMPKVVGGLVVFISSLLLVINLSRGKAKRIA